MKMLTPQEAAERVGISQNLIYLWCDERRLPHVRAGARGRRGRILIHPEDLDALLQALRVEAAEEHHGPPPLLKHIRLN